MKTLAIALAAATVLTAGAAAAQPYGYGRGDYGRGDYARGDYARGDYARGDYARGDYGRGNYVRGDRWMSIDERRARLEQRIDQGLRSGQLTRGEAYRLRREFQRITYLENRYRADGLSSWERADLDRRFEILSAQIRSERHDGDRYGYNEYPRY